VGQSAYVVGAGVVSPAGCSISSLWPAIRDATGTLAGRRTYDELELTVAAAEAADFDPSHRLAPHEIRRLDRSHQMAICAADDALDGLPNVPAERVAVVIGVGYGAAGYAETQYAAVAQRGWRAASPLTIPVVMPNSIAAHLSLRYGFTGPTITVAAACASGAVAIGEALWLLRSGRADRVLCGGVDALHTPGVTAFFQRLDAMTKRIDEPTLASRPFDVQRDGFVLGEGAAMLVLQLTPAGRPLGRILGYATNSDAYHLVAPDPSGGGAATCMLAAIADAGIDPKAVGHVNAHGTSTVLNDATEAAAIRAVCNDATPVFAPKSVLGHLVGAAGAIEAIVSLQALTHQEIPPTVNTREQNETPGPLNLGSSARPHDHTLGISNSFAFGGINASLVLST
jgi:3-oxoacyl-[acyl-carrier-protein] synthase II